MEDLKDKTFGFLKVIGIYNANSRGTSYLCRCICGKEIVLPHSILIGNKTRKPNKSCGCMKDSQKGLSSKYPRIHKTWYGMIRRCYNPKNDNYERYGGKGITVCEEWRNNFQSFLEWALNNGYAENLTLDRKDSSQGYSPDNYRWSTYLVQEHNRRIFRNNVTGVKGVTYSPDYGGYRASLMVRRKRIHSEYFPNIDDAIEARKKMEEERMCLVY